MNRKTVPKTNIVLTVLTHNVPLHIFTFLVTRELIIKVLNENYKLFPPLPPLIRYIEYSYKVYMVGNLSIERGIMED